jgi:hypothetical protein
MSILTKPPIVIYICHHCIRYHTPNKADLERHLNKKKQCKQFNDISFDEAYILSLDRKYTFLFDVENLTHNDFKFIIDNYTYDRNYIYENFYTSVPTNNQNEIIENKNEVSKKISKNNVIEIETKNISNVQELINENKITENKEEHIYKYYKSKICNFNSSNYEDVQEYVYMIQLAANVAKKDNIIKIGMSKCNDPMVRIKNYDRGYKIIQISLVKDALKVEKELLVYFRQHFTHCNHLGREIFQGSIQDMIIAFKMIT